MWEEVWGPWEEREALEVEVMGGESMGVPPMGYGGRGKLHEGWKQGLSPRQKGFPGAGASPMEWSQ